MFLLPNENIFILASYGIGRKLIQNIEQFFASRSKYPRKQLNIEMNGNNIPW